MQWHHKCHCNLHQSRGETHLWNRRPLSYRLILFRVSVCLLQCFVKTIGTVSELFNAMRCQKQKRNMHTHKFENKRNSNRCQFHSIYSVFIAIWSDHHDINNSIMSVKKKFVHHFFLSSINLLSFSLVEIDFERAKKTTGTEAHDSKWMHMILAMRTCARLLKVSLYLLGQSQGDDLDFSSRLRMWCVWVPIRVASSNENRHIVFVCLQVYVTFMWVHFKTNISFTKMRCCRNRPSNR